MLPLCVKVGKCGKCFYFCACEMVTNPTFVSPAHT